MDWLVVTALVIAVVLVVAVVVDRKSTRLNSSHLVISYAVFCLKKKKQPARSDIPSSHRTVDSSRRQSHPLRPARAGGSNVWTRARGASPPWHAGGIAAYHHVHRC